MTSARGGGANGLYMIGFGYDKGRERGNRETVTAGVTFVSMWPCGGDGDSGFVGTTTLL